MTVLLGRINFRLNSGLRFSPHRSRIGSHFHARSASCVACSPLWPRHRSSRRKKTFMYVASSSTATSPAWRWFHLTTSCPTAQRRRRRRNHRISEGNVPLRGVGVGTSKSQQMPPPAYVSTNSETAICSTLTSEQEVTIQKLPVPNSSASHLKRRLMQEAPHA